MKVVGTNASFYPEMGRIEPKNFTFVHSAWQVPQNKGISEYHQGIPDKPLLVLGVLDSWENSIKDLIDMAELMI
jgi:hypothetical protein